MSDRELLEDAAKAAGMMFDPTVKNKHGLMVVAKDAACQSEQFFWNPLTDDGDALRLAVKLRKMPVIERWSDGHDWVFIPGHEGGALPLGDDPLAATRRAIVRAAAEIGEGKK